MIQRTSRQWTAIVIVLAVVIVLTATLYSEDMLKKKTAKYLGWQTGRDEFTTCDNSNMKIAPDGKIEKTEQKCDKAPGPGPMSGHIMSLNSQDLTLVFVSDKGSQMTLYYPELSNKEVIDKLEALKDNKRKVQVNSPANGRAESVRSDPN